jgi:hypothetical protein
LGEHFGEKIDLHHAAECRDMARSASSTHRKKLEQMAETWEGLADAQKHELQRREATDKHGLVIEFEVPPDYDNNPKRKS